MQKFLDRSRSLLQVWVWLGLIPLLLWWIWAAMNRPNPWVVGFVTGLLEFLGLFLTYHLNLSIELKKQAAAAKAKEKKDDPKKEEGRNVVIIQ